MIVESDFRAAAWCRGPHFQTLWPYFFRLSPRPHYRRERIELPDGDFVDLDWHEPPASGPLAVLLHGLEGCSQSHYIRGLADALARRRIRSVVLHHRGCSGVPNRLDRGYHAGETTDLNYVVTRLRSREPDTSIAVVGFSLGGNMLLKWLTDGSAASSINAAAAISVPFLLAEGAHRMEQGLSRIYQWRLLKMLRRSAIRKFSRRTAPLDLARLRSLRTFWAFDDYVTAPLHGFAGAQDYYTRCSSRQFLRDVAVNTLIVQSLDDPLMTPRVLPREDELSEHIVLEISVQGGHVGFVSGPIWRPIYWLDHRISDYVSEQLVRA